MSSDPQDDDRSPRPAVRAARRRRSRSARPPGRRTRHHPRTWTALAVVVVLALAGAALLSAHDHERWPFRTPTAHRPLLSAGIAVADDGSRRLLEPADPTPAGPVPLARRPLTTSERAWLAEGTVPARGTAYEDMATRALLDLRALTLPLPAHGDGTLRRYAVVAGWVPYWHYVWPRDAAFAAVALTRSGHATEGVGALALLADLQDDDGTFRARYLPDGSGAVPDDRPGQVDSAGWVLWASDAVLTTLEADPADATQVDPAAAWRALGPMVVRTTRRALDLTHDGTRLPPASPDYWEVSEHRVTLGTVGPLLAGLEASAHLLAARQAPPGLADRAAQAASALRTTVETTFGAQGYPRHLGGLSALGSLGRVGPLGRLGRDASDTATAFVLPPFVSTPLEGALAAWRRSVPAMLRPAGGLAPGGSWRHDGMSWTPTTSLYALAAASVGDIAAAHRWLDWLDAHRTAQGSLPEKVLAGGAPAAVAPLAWTDANVLLALLALDG